MRRSEHAALIRLIAFGVAAMLSLQPMIASAATAAAGDGGPTLCLGGVLVTTGDQGVVVEPCVAASAAEAGLATVGPSEAVRIDVVSAADALATWSAPTLRPAASHHPRAPPSAPFRRDAFR